MKDSTSPDSFQFDGCMSCLKLECCIDLTLEASILKKRRQDELRTFNIDEHRRRKIGAPSKVSNKL
jgi:hypothetical protein